MIKLDSITPREGFISAQENWSINNDIKVRVTRHNGYAFMGVSYLGDIADQVYEKAKFISDFSDLQLEVFYGYTLVVPLEKIEMLLQFIEKIDRNKLKKGHCY